MSSFESKRNFFEKISTTSQFTKTPSKHTKENLNEDQSAILVLNNDVLVFDTESDAYEHVIYLTEKREQRLQKQHATNSSTNDSGDESDDYTLEDDECPFVIKMVNVNPKDYEFQNFYK